MEEEESKVKARYCYGHQDIPAVCCGNEATITFSGNKSMLMSIGDRKAEIDLRNVTSLELDRKTQMVVVNFRYKERNDCVYLKASVTTAETLYQTIWNKVGKSYTPRPPVPPRGV